MKHELMNILKCPACKGTLELSVSKQDGDEIVEGDLKCQQCEETYPIEETIPILLSPNLRS